MPEETILETQEEVVSKEQFKSIRESLGAAYLRGVMFLLFASQVIVGQALPLSFQRPPTILSSGLEKYVCFSGAVGISWVVATLLVISAFSRRFQYWSAIMFSFFKLSMAFSVWSVDYYVGLYMILFAIAGVALAASSKGAE